MNDVALAVALVRINDPAPAILRNRAAVAPRPPSTTELVSDQLPVLTKSHNYKAVRKHNA